MVSFFSVLVFCRQSCILTSFFPLKEVRRGTQAQRQAALSQQLYSNSAARRIKKVPASLSHPAHMHSREGRWVRAGGDRAESSRAKRGRAERSDAPFWPAHQAGVFSLLFISPFPRSFSLQPHPFVFVSPPSSSAAPPPPSLSSPFNFGSPPLSLPPPFRRVLIYKFPQLS